MIRQDSLRTASLFGAPRLGCYHISEATPPPLSLVRVGSTAFASLHWAVFGCDNLVPIGRKKISCVICMRGVGVSAKLLVFQVRELGENVALSYQYTCTHTNHELYQHDLYSHRFCSRKQCCPCGETRLCGSW
jgi:hypothetical protein